MRVKQDDETKENEWGEASRRRWLETRGEITKKKE
jgi:hypothetical protein